MSLLPTYRAARASEDFARLQRIAALRGMVATGMSQREIAKELGISQPAVSQQLKTADEFARVPTRAALDAAAPTLKSMAAQAGYRDLAVFGSVARGVETDDSDIDLLVQSPPDTSTIDFLRFKAALQSVLGRPVDLVDAAGLRPGLDDDIRREAVPL